MGTRIETKRVKVWLEGKQLADASVTLATGFLYLHWTDARISMTGLDKTRDKVQRDGADAIVFHFCGEWDEPPMHARQVDWPVKIQFCDEIEYQRATELCAL